MEIWLENETDRSKSEIWVLVLTSKHNADRSYCALGVPFGEEQVCATTVCNFTCLAGILTGHLHKSSAKHLMLVSASIRLLASRTAWMSL